MTIANDKDRDNDQDNERLSSTTGDLYPSKKDVEQIPRDSIRPGDEPHGTRQVGRFLRGNLRGSGVKLNAGG